MIIFANLFYYSAYWVEVGEFEILVWVGPTAFGENDML